MDVLREFLRDRKATWTSCTDVVYPFEAIRALEVALKHSPALNFVTAGGRTGSGGSFFSPDMLGPLPGGLAVHTGWYQNVKVADGRFAGQTAGQGGATAIYKILMNLDVK
jgi:hypothetical protein